MGEYYPLYVCQFSRLTAWLCLDGFVHIGFLGGLAGLQTWLVDILEWVAVRDAIRNA